MKQIIAICGIAILTASCNTAAVRQQEEMLKAQAATIETMKVEMAKQRVIDSMNQEMAANTAPVQKETPVVVRTVRKKEARTYSEPVAMAILIPIRAIAILPLSQHLCKRHQ
jgi:PBP1b-binding outer membrane lipoprotein LpoB